MTGQKRSSTNAKKSAISKRHKPSSSAKSSAKKHTSHPNGLASSRDQSAFPTDKPAKQSAKKDRKGKGPALILPVQATAEYSTDNDEDDLGMEIEEEVGDIDFLTKMNVEGMSTSRPALVAQYRQEKPGAAPRKSTLSKIPLLPQAPLKSEIKALKKKAIERKKRGTDFEEDESGQEAGSGPTKAHKDGELIDDLEDDDLAFGSGSEDDLSLMSEMSDMSDISDMSDMSESDLDEEESAAEDDDEDEKDDEGTDDEESCSESERSMKEDDDAHSFESSFDSELDFDEHDDRPPPPPIDAVETAYEARPKHPKARPTVSKLPTIINGTIIRAASPLSAGAASDRSPSPEYVKAKKEVEYRSDPLGQRFGRPAIRMLLEIKSKKERIARAREEIADLGREASGTGEGEGGLNLLKRLLSLTAPKFSSSSSAKSAGERAISVDREIRVMAMLSLLAVLVDIVPGYRIRPLTEAEKDVKVSQMVARQREWEDGLVAVYKRFLEVCEAEVNEDSPIAPAAIHCLCQLVKEKPDFNFAVNIMDVVVKRVGRKGWDEGHQVCLATIVYLFSNDTTTAASNSLHLVRLISRLVRARSFAVRPEVISALLNLRLRDELGGGRVRASADAVFREKEGRKGVVKWNKVKDHRGRKGGRAKEAMSKAGSKKARAAKKERQGIEKEMREAEGEIDAQERERNMTETLKLLFALYFRIIKLEYRNPLTPAALEGLARFSHLVNVDFFRDLLEVLKGIIQRGSLSGIEEEDEEEGVFTRRNDQREKLLCIVTAFELLQGQGEALNIDLGDFVSALYALVLPLSLSPTFEEAPYVGRNEVTQTSRATAKLAQTEADLLFRALAAIFLVPRSVPSAVRTLAFSKRLLTASLNWPSSSQLRTLIFLRSLLIREPKLEAMLETGDRRVDGKWRGMVDEPERAEPEGTCWWEASLYRTHPDEKVRAEANKLMNWVRD